MRTLLPFLLCASVQLGCANQNIPNTRVEDTDENREVLEFVERYRNAVEQRDVASLTSMTSKDYYDDMGTPAGKDDVDYDALVGAFVDMREELLGARYQISYRGVTYTHNRVLVDVLYTGWFKVQTPDGPEWRRRLQPHRMVLARELNEYKIVSGM